MGAWAANGAGVLVALVLLGIEMWVVGIAALAHVVSQEVISAPIVLRAGATIGASTVIYAAVVILVRAVLPP
jgi:UDP-3-O-[3-hydroxymyristoyl] glucosamine N-acyltransferase